MYRVAARYAEKASENTDIVYNQCKNRQSQSTCDALKLIAVIMDYGGNLEGDCPRS